MNLLFRAAAVAAVLALLVSPALAQQAKGKRRNELPPDDGRPPQATPVSQMKVLKDFQAELLYSVPRTQGSWVCMCVDPQGRLIISDQGTQGLYRITPPPIGGDASAIKIE